MRGRRPRPTYDPDFTFAINDDDRIRVRVRHQHGQVFAFVVQLEIFDGNVYRPERRCDTAHGYSHWDILDWDGRTIQKIPVVGALEFGQALDVAIADLNANAERYRDEFLERRP